MAHNEAYRNAEEKIEHALRTGATSLDLGVSYNVWDEYKLVQIPESLFRLTQLQLLSLSSNGLTSLPESLSQLTALQSLNISSNALTILPESLRELTQLQELNLIENELTMLPESLGQLTQLETLWLSENQLTMLPESVGQLTQLRFLDLTANQLTRLPESLGQLTQLETLWLTENQLTMLPESVGQLTQLESLRLSGNQLTTLPKSFTKLEHLVDLKLAKNPLNPELAAACHGDLDALKLYLRELAKGAKKRYEAKLMILGDGNAGKTCVSRALRGLKFEEQLTTHGVDVEQWPFANPDHIDDEEKQITLNIWDFEGQEINHQTHQFFLNSQSLYLLVFKCRDKFSMDSAEYWLDTIRARAPHAKVAIVITQCEQRTPYIPQDKLQDQYQDLLVEGKWLYAVGCANNSGIKELQDFLKRFAASFRYIEREWPASYDKAEAAIKRNASEGAAHINRGQLNDIFAECGLDQNSFRDIASAMSILGIITQFQDCPDLRDFIVLQPQWLTKAISEIMENRELTRDQGEIELSRMEEIWEENGYKGMFPIFHNCMKEFELCYDLEDTKRSCLVPLRFGYQKPLIPWSSITDVKERRVEYKLNIRPPIGLMSRFIVKTHNMIVKTPGNLNGVYWHNGVFLRTDSGDFASEALCEFDRDERKFCIQVRAAFPQNMTEQIHAYVKSVFSFFSGLVPERRYGCIKIDEQTRKEEQCEALHPEKRISYYLKNDRVLGCEIGLHDVHPMTLISGYNSFNKYVLSKDDLDGALRHQLDQKPEWAEPLTNWVEENRQKLNQLLTGQENMQAVFKQELQLKFQEYLTSISQMLDNREATSAPGLISLHTENGSKWNPAGYFKSTYVMTPFCECEGNIHSCIDGQVKFTKDKEWWVKSAPWIARATKLLSIGLQLSFVGMPVALGSNILDGVKDDVKFMNELSKHLELEVGAKDTSLQEDFIKGSAEKDLRGRDKDSRLMRTALARFLKETAPDNYEARQWGSLHRYRMPDDSYRWLCVEHQPKS